MDRSNNAGLATACPSEIQKRGARDLHWRRYAALLQTNEDEPTNFIDALCAACPRSFREINARAMARMYRR